MRRLIPSIIMALLMMTGVLAGEIVLAQEGPQYEVTVTNLTRGQQFTPILVASHEEGVSLFTLGTPAGAELETLAEEGDTGPLTDLLSGMPEVRDVVSSSGLLDPGASVTVAVGTDSGFDHLSVAAMLIPTNDAFFSITGVEGPAEGETLVRFPAACDAGSEVNDELCASIPGPDFAECGGPGTGGMPSGGEEGFVHIHAGIHGIGDLNASERDWRNPVAKITVRRISPPGEPTDPLDCNGDGVVNGNDLLGIGCP